MKTMVINLNEQDGTLRWNEIFAADGTRDLVTMLGIVETVRAVLRLQILNGYTALELAKEAAAVEATKAQGESNG